MTDQATSPAEAVREVISHSACGQNECLWIDCAEHQWAGGRLVDEGWCKMQFATLRVALLGRYLTRCGCRPEVTSAAVIEMFESLIDDDPDWLHESEVRAIWRYVKGYFGS